MESSLSGIVIVIVNYAHDCFHMSTDVFVFVVMMKKKIVEWKETPTDGVVSKSGKGTSWNKYNSIVQLRIYVSTASKLIVKSQNGCQITIDN